jgi:hypothetical protein
MRAILRYYILPAIVAVAIWILPLLAFGIYARDTSGGGPAAGGASAGFYLVCLFGIPIPLAWLIDLRRRWKERGDVRKFRLFGIPSVLGAIPGCSLIAIFIFLEIPEHPNTWEALSNVLCILAVTVGLPLLGLAGAAAWYSID